MSELRKSKVSRGEMARLYTEGLLTMEEISHLAGISKQAVKYALDHEGVEYRGGEVKRSCRYCHGEFIAQRGRIKKGEANYCSINCFHAARVINPDRYLIIKDADKRNGNRTARQIMRLKANDSRVVHHKDGDPTNNDINNLEIYANQAEHMAAHHRCRG